MNRKGAVTIITIILAVMLTIAIASGMYFWFTKIQSSSQQNTQQYSEELLTDIITELKVVEAPVYNTLAEGRSCIPASLTFYVQNTGTRKVELDKAQSDLRIWNFNKDTICFSTLDGACTSTEVRLYAIAEQGPAAEINYTTDGESWSAKQALTVDVANDMEKLYEDIFIGSDAGKIFKTCNNEEWGSEKVDLLDFGISLKNFQNTLYAGGANDSSEPYGHVYKRFNSSEWSSVYSTGEKIVKSLEVFNNKLYAGTHGDSGGKIFESSDGSSWSEKNSSITNVSAMYTNNSHIYVGARNGNIYRSSDGQNFALMQSLNEEEVVAFEYFNDLLIVIASNASNSSIYTSGDGQTWTLRSSFSPYYTTYDLEVFGNQLYAGGMNGTIFNSSTGTETWTNLANLSVAANIRALQNHTKCTNYKANCTRGCDSEIVPGETRLMEIKLSDTDCDITSFGTSTEYNFKINFRSEAQLIDRFGKSLIDSSTTGSLCEYTYPICHGSCSGTNNCMYLPEGCVCMPQLQCNEVDPLLMDCSVGSCPSGSCQSIGGGICGCVE